MPPLPTRNITSTPPTLRLSDLLPHILGAPPSHPRPPAARVNHDAQIIIEAIDDVLNSVIEQAELEPEAAVHGQDAVDASANRSD